MSNSNKYYLCVLSRMREPESLFEEQGDPILLDFLITINEVLDVSSTSKWLVNVNDLNRIYSRYKTESNIHSIRE